MAHEFDTVIRGGDGTTMEPREIAYCDGEATGALPLVRGPQGLVA